MGGGTFAQIDSLVSQFILEGDTAPEPAPALASGTGITPRGLTLQLRRAPSPKIPLWPDRSFAAAPISDPANLSVLLLSFRLRSANPTPTKLFEGG